MRSIFLILIATVAFDSVIFPSASNSNDGKSLITTDQTEELKRISQELADRDAIINALTKELQATQEQVDKSAKSYASHLQHTQEELEKLREQISPRKFNELLTDAKKNFDDDTEKFETARRISASAVSYCRQDINDNLRIIYTLTQKLHDIQKQAKETEAAFNDAQKKLEELKEQIHPTKLDELLRELSARETRERAEDRKKELLKSKRMISPTRFNKVEEELTDAKKQVDKQTKELKCAREELERLREELERAREEIKRRMSPSDIDELHQEILAARNVNYLLTTNFKKHSENTVAHRNQSPAETDNSDTDDDE